MLVLQKYTLMDLGKKKHYASNLLSNGQKMINDRKIDRLDRKIER